jgi:hypothetical protein
VGDLVAVPFELDCDGLDESDIVFSVVSLSETVLDTVASSVSDGVVLIVSVSDGDMETLVDADVVMLMLTETEDD